MTIPVLGRLTVSNILSFGPTPQTIELGPLNVLIGPNGSGKSNFLEILSLVEALPSDLAVPLREGGGVREWAWKGTGTPANPTVVVESEDNDGRLVHRLELDSQALRPRLAQEQVLDIAHDGNLVDLPRELYDLSAAGTQPSRSRSTRDMASQSITAHSVTQHTEIIRLAELYSSINVYRDWPSGARSSLRSPQPADLPNDVLLPGGENLGLVLSALQSHPPAYDAMRAAMAKFYPAFHELQLHVVGNTVQVFIREKGLATPIPSTRLSDGTMRYLALLAVLLNPDPGGLVALEEPETGLHPDILPDLVRLLEDAATRTQVVITTHSDHLVNALSHRPEAIVVTERGPDGTTFQRLDAEKLAVWLESYRLGELWMTGHLGGTRW